MCVKVMVIQCGSGCGSGCGCGCGSAWTVVLSSLVQCTGSLIKQMNGASCPQSCHQGGRLSVAPPYCTMALSLRLIGLVRLLVAFKQHIHNSGLTFFYFKIFFCEDLLELILLLLLFSYFDIKLSRLNYIRTRKMKSVYHTLNQFSLREGQRVLVGEGWMPTSEMGTIRSLGNSIVQICKCINI